MEMQSSEEYIKMEMECETQQSFRKGRPYSRQTGIFVLLGIVCMIIFMVLISVSFSHQERKFSMLESWMKSHSSDLTSVKSDFQTTGSDVENKVAELQSLVSGLSAYLNTSGSSNSVQAKKLSDIETLMTGLSSSLDLLKSKHEENQQKLESQQNVSYTEVKKQMDTLSASVSSIMSKLTADSRRTSLMFLQSISHNQRILDELSSSMENLKNLIMEMRSIVRSLTYRISVTKLLEPGCSDSAWVLFSNSCYLFSSDEMSWTEAKDYCEEKGAWLLKMEDEDHWQFITVFTQPFPYWIGLTDQNTGQWRWMDGTNYTLNKEHWRPGQPDDWTEHGLGEEGEDCAHITYEGLLNDAHCSIKMKFICEMKK